MLEAGIHPLALVASGSLLRCIPPNSSYESKRDRSGIKPHWHRLQTYSTPNHSSLHQPAWKEKYGRMDRLTVIQVGGLRLFQVGWDWQGLCKAVLQTCFVLIVFSDLWLWLTLIVWCCVVECCIPLSEGVVFFVFWTSNWNNVLTWYFAISFCGSVCIIEWFISSCDSCVRKCFYQHWWQLHLFWNISINLI